MKKILIVNSNMQIGGIQKALANMLNKIEDQFEIDLLLFDDQGALMRSVPPSVQLLPTNNKLRILGRGNRDCKRLGWQHYLLSCILRLYCVCRNNRRPIRILLGKKKLQKKYDVAISFMQPGSTKFLYGGCAEFVLNNVDAVTKVAYIHCDYSKYAGNERLNTTLLSKFDKIACVSESCANRFVAATNNTNCVMTAYNFADYDSIRSLSCAKSVEYTDQLTHFVTVARLSQEKGICETLPLVKKLVETGVTKFQWHIVGDGHLRSQIDEMIDTYDLSKYVIMHGATDNPYPYIKQASCMLICSIHEAAPMVYEEAACLGTPILTTKTCSSTELVVHKGYGIEVASQDVLFLQMKKIVMDNKYLDDYRDSLGKKEFTNKIPLAQFKRLVEDGNSK